MSSSPEWLGAVTLYDVSTVGRLGTDLDIGILMTWFM